MKKVDLKKSENLPAAIEAILFVYGEPLSVSRILKIIRSSEIFSKATKDEVMEVIEILKKNFSDSGDSDASSKRGLILISAYSGNDEEIQLVTRPELSSMLESFIKEEFKESLTPASLETLAIVSYLGPLSRAEIDHYRGVNSSFILRSLLMRGLVQRFPNQDRASIFLYRASFDLLKYLGIKNAEALPNYNRFREMKNKQEPPPDGDGLIS